MFRKLDLRYGDIVKVKNVAPDFDGTMAKVVGLSVRHVVDIYILELLDGKTGEMPDGMKYSSFCMPEVCLDRIQ